jgi:aromatic-L-amino-acid/L-tryptophan decarboxylase
VWMCLKAYGARRLGRLVAQNIEQARALTERNRADPSLELLAPTSLNIVCFRFRAPGLDEAQLARLNEELLVRLQESGVAVPSSARVRGRFALRVAIVNHRSRSEDFDLLLDKVRELGAALVGPAAHGG